MTETENEKKPPFTEEQLQFLMQNLKIETDHRTVYGYYGGDKSHYVTIKLLLGEEVISIESFSIY